MSIEGQQLNGGRYHLLSLLSRSNTSEVYLAEDTQLSRQVAIKIILPETSAYPGADATVFGSRLFIREVEIIKTFNHPHILPLLDYGNEPVSGMMLTYLVMPFCPDGSFAAWLRQHSSLLPSKDVVEIVRQVADALKYAHDHQILHLSIKPSNFLMQSCGENKHRPDLLLTNFKMVKSNSAPAGAGRTIDSNPSYMAPEQWHGSPVPATDQYALAVVAYELVTGHPPFQGTSEQLREQHLNAQPQPPSTINPRLPKAVDEVILHALAKKPADRFISVTAFAYAFGQAMQNSAMSANAHKLTEPKQVAPPKITPGIVVSPGTYPAGIETSKKRIIPSNMKANILLYCALTGAICFIVGIMLNTLGILPPLVANIASSIGAAIAFIAGSWGFLQKLFPMNVWLNARKLPVVSFSLVTVVIITVAALYLSSLNAVPTDPYVHHGTLQFEDPLLDNSQGHNWYTGPQSNNHQDIGACMFKNGAYHAIESSSSPFFVSCRDTADNFSDFVFEVQMKIIQGDFGGIVFRYNTNTSDAYYVEFNQRGEYFLSLKTGTKHILASGNPASIHAGLNQSNLIAVVAQGNTITLFANNQHLATVLGNSLSVGQIALIAYNGGSPTEVEYSNAKLWAL